MCIKALLWFWETLPETTSEFAFNLKLMTAAYPLILTKACTENMLDQLSFINNLQKLKEVYKDLRSTKRLFQKATKPSISPTFDGVSVAGHKHGRQKGCQ